MEWHRALLHFLRGENDISLISAVKPSNKVRLTEFVCWYCADSCIIIMQPAILPIQIIRIGQLVILCVPGGKFPIPHL